MMVYWGNLSEVVESGTKSTYEVYENVVAGRGHKIDKKNPHDEEFDIQSIARKETKISDDLCIVDVAFE
jgi:hypothetical protein